jgi:pseudaminic acid synthase
VSVKPAEVMFIAEISANHLGSLERARQLVGAAAKSGATAVKFQTYTPDTMTLDIPEFRVSNDHELWGGRNLYSLYQEAHMPWEWQKELFELASSLGVIPFSTPFDITAVKFLENLGSTMYKIASLETGDHRLIRAVAETGKPIIVSTGATELAEIDELVQVIRQTGNQNLTLMLCTSAYPTDAEDVHLRRMRTLRDRFECNVGLSDHTLGIGVSIAAIALGAVAIEKHLTVNRADGGADSQFSLEPSEFKLLTEEGDRARRSLGNNTWTIQSTETESRRLRRTLYVTKDVKEGEHLTYENIRAIRPGGGIEPKFLDAILGKKFKSDLVLGTPLNFSHFE